MTDAIILEQQVTPSSYEVEERTPGRVKFNSANHALVDDNTKYPRTHPVVFDIPADTDPDPAQLSNVILGAAVCLSFVLFHQMCVTFGEVLSSGVT